MLTSVSGIPTLVANYIPAGMNVVLQSENGLLGMGPFLMQEKKIGSYQCRQTDNHYGAGFIFFDSAMSFGMIRAGKVDLTVLGQWKWVIQVISPTGKFPVKMVKGMGGHGPGKSQCQKYHCNHDAAINPKVKTGSCCRKCRLLNTYRSPAELAMLCKKS